MNCKNCGFPLNGNQTCSNCGTVNEVNNTPIVTQPVEVKKKSKGLVIILVVIGLLLVGGGVFLGLGVLGNNSTNNNTDNTNTQKEEKNPDAAIANNQIFVDKMTNKEIYDLTHTTLSMDIIEGSTTNEFYQKLPVSETGKEPVSNSVSSIEIKYGFMGVVLGDKQRDNLEEVTFTCKYDYDTEKIYKSTTKVLPKAANMTFNIYSGRGKELYEYFKTQYSALYPGVEVKETTNDDYIDFKITTAEQKYAHVRLTEKYSGRYDLFIEEAIFNY